ncbi:hypothetical protein VNO77_02724 [Canavalia gladiata]|uniref:Uncharacterized protein n=1 Tax=Canavalia gladiata TaxID=3824 RepID=A0AAN9MTG1_CANGL
MQSMGFKPRVLWVVKHHTHHLNKPLVGFISLSKPTMVHFPANLLALKGLRCCLFLLDWNNGPLVGYCRGYIASAWASPLWTYASTCMAAFLLLANIVHGRLLITHHREILQRQLRRRIRIANDIDKKVHREFVGWFSIHGWDDVEITLKSTLVKAPPGRTIGPIGLVTIAKAKKLQEDVKAPLRLQLMCEDFSLFLALTRWRRKMANRFLGVASNFKTYAIKPSSIQTSSIVYSIF